MVASTNACPLNNGKCATVASQVSGHEPKSGGVSVVQIDMCLSSPCALLLDCFPLDLRSRACLPVCTGPIYLAPPTPQQSKSWCPAPEAKDKNFSSLVKNDIIFLQPKCKGPDYILPLFFLINNLLHHYIEQKTSKKIPKSFIPFIYYISN